jgi:Uma2 family endonuclease
MQPMATITDFSLPMGWVTVADLWQRLGQVPLERIRLTPTPGTAIEQDVLDSIDHADRICELVDGVLVEKTLGYIESLLAMAIGEFLRRFVRDRKLGIVLGPDGTLRILPRQVRIPDVCFLSWERFPGGKLPQTPIPAVAPDLAVEVLSEGNTEGEMRRKLQDYFTAGVRLVWYVDPRTRTAAVYTSPEQSTVLGENDVLTGGDVLPGFRLPLRELFAEVDGK